MGTEGLQPLSLSDYESLRSSHVPLEAVEPEKSSYLMVGRIASSEIQAAIIDTYNIRIQQGRRAITAMLLRDEVNLGLRHFEGYEALDEKARLTIYHINESGLQLFLPEHGRLQLLSGYLIDTIRKPTRLVQEPAHLYAQLEEGSRTLVQGSR